ncbi:MAG: alcohol dehydrogenase catalytic domain-containing protein [Planctomycetaceae bacterium]|jgi:L-iditol 2-dehydrogenase|nr:alcohol dehydrogenase catalytic domain-containing protein [Planctomycetaceae bacterium]
MNAVVYYAPGDIRYEEVPNPVCGEGEILVKVDACAVCGTDLKSKLNGNPRIKAPLIMGHEFTGITESGDRIVMATSIACGQCFYCKQGFRNLCSELAPMGFSYPGGMAQYVVLPKAALDGGHVIKVPAGVPAQLAALAEPASCAVNAVSQSFTLAGDTASRPRNVLIMGAGPMGLLNAVIARSMTNQAGAVKVFLTETNPLRRKQAEQFDVDVIIDPLDEDVDGIIRKQTGNLGVDIVIVAAPAAAPQEQALSFVRKRGVVCLFASLPAGKSALSIDSRLIHYGELRVIGSSDSAPHHVQEAVSAIQKNPETFAKIASHRLPLADFEKAFELMKSGAALRVVLLP